MTNLPYVLSELDTEIKEYTLLIPMLLKSDNLSLIDDSLKLFSPDVSGYTFHLVSRSTMGQISLTNKERNNGTKNYISIKYSCPPSVDEYIAEQILDFLSMKDREVYFGQI